MEATREAGRPAGDRTARFFEEFSLRTSLAVFAVVVCAAMCAGFASDAVHAHAVAVAVARRAAENLAESLAQQGADTFEAVDGALLALADRAGGTVSAAERERLHESMAELITTMPRLHDVLLIDAAGRSIASNGSAAPRPDLDFRSKPYFRYHAAHRGTNARISGAVRSDTEDAWVIEMTRRVDTPDGRFAGVAVAQIAIDYFERVYANVDIGRAGAIVLAADDGTVVARRPRVSDQRSLRQSSMFSGPDRYASSGWFVHASPLDGVLRLVAFRRLDRYPLAVAVSLAESEYLADWRADTSLDALALVCTMLLVGGLACGLGAQIGQRKSAEDALARMALVDGLTGVANRRQFDVAFEREWRIGARDRIPFALLMIDIDSFKTYNDRYGHRHGDTTLTAIAQTIAANVVRPRDVAARYGGEEFAVILPETDLASAVIVAERIRSAVVGLGIPHADGIDARVSVSIGAAALVPALSAPRALLIEAADGALYAAKRGGRNRTCTPSLGPPFAGESAGGADAPVAGDGDSFSRRIRS